VRHRWRPATTTRIRATRSGPSSRTWSASIRASTTLRAPSGSLDSEIDRTSIVANDFERFFEQHARVGRVFFNGGNAEALYRRHVRRTLAPTRALSYLRLPSTSPANASIAATAKAEAWRVVIAPTGVPDAAFE
jgi:G:T/U-mismatch repair DNA glycosylase